MDDKATLAMKEFLERIKRLQEKAGTYIHYMGCGEYNFTQQVQGADMTTKVDKKEMNMTSGGDKDASSVTVNYPAHRAGHLKP